MLKRGSVNKQNNSIKSTKSKSLRKASIVVGKCNKISRIANEVCIHIDDEDEISNVIRDIRQKHSSVREIKIVFQEGKGTDITKG